jgi:hypothetical protein
MSVLTAAFLLATATFAGERKLTFVSTQPTTLIEVFTSEGCSSCPPADKWVAGIKKGLWQEVVPVVFHVDYWNYLGWRDNFSQEKFSDHHYRYGKEWRTNSVATPTVARNGYAWDGWRIGISPQKTGKQNSRRIELLYEPDSRKLALSFDAEGKECLRANAAIMVRNFPSRITAGENKGLVLDHAFAAIDLVQFPLKSDGKSYAGDAAFSAKTDFSANAIAAWVTPCTSQVPLRAVGGEF